MTELVGWTAAAILFATLARQVYTQWRERSVRGVSRFLFVGQCAASTGFVIYSFLLGSWVFVAINLLVLATAVAGEVIYLRNKARAGGPHASAGSASPQDEDSNAARA